MDFFSHSAKNHNALRNSDNKVHAQEFSAGNKNTIGSWSHVCYTLVEYLSTFSLYPKNLYEDEFKCGRKFL